MLLQFDDPFSKWIWILISTIKSSKFVGWFLLLHRNCHIQKLQNSNHVQKWFEHIVAPFCWLDLHCFCRSIAYIEFHTESFSFFPIFHYLIHKNEEFLKLMKYNIWLHIFTIFILRMFFWPNFFNFKLIQINLAGPE